MNRRQEVCRDFQRGNCRFGVRCKFLHTAPQQQQQQQQQQQRPRHQRNEGRSGGNYYDVLGGNTDNSNQRQPQNQTQSSAKEHRCNDPRVCKEQIKEDFANDHPVFWRLTCYAHYKFLPNDIVGDVSPEELRALAYEGAKQGLSLKDVAQREATMVAAKNAEFEALLRSPYKGAAVQNSQPAPFASSPFLSPPQKSMTYMPFGQPNPLSGPPKLFAQTPFGGTPGNSFSFGQPSVGVEFGPQATNESNGNTTPFVQQANSFQQSPFGVIAAQPQQNHFTNMQGSNAAFNTNAFHSSVFPPQSTVTQMNSPFVQDPAFTPSTFGHVANFNTQDINLSMGTQAPISQMLPVQQLQPKSAVSGDSVWLADVWKIGELPEDEPPPHVRY